VYSIVSSSCVEGYGQTESTLLCGTFKKMNKWVKPGSIGKAAPGYDVRIVNNMGKEVPRGEQAGGQLAFKEIFISFKGTVSREKYFLQV
jgi:acyl-coenzyme A synthetase/AMP-(fatty) acid ligase